MIGASFSNWGEVADAAYYTGAGGGEALWLWISVALCVVACVLGSMHESKINAK